MTYGTVLADVMQTSTSGGILGAGNASIMKNRIINGAMTISQYNGTSSVTPTSDTYVLDRYKVVRSQNNLSFQQNAGSVTPPVGFANYLGITVGTGATVGAADYWYLAQFIEGFNTSDLQWGTANAKTVTLSFWVRASVTGSYSVGFHNSAEDRAYLATYTISVANTWEYKTITVAGDTSGTWIGATNGRGIEVFFNLGTGSTFGTSTSGSWIAGWNTGLTTGVQLAANTGATFYITGVQLEVGSSATGFEYENYATLLVKCQRYFSKAYNMSEAIGGSASQNQRSLVTPYAGSEYSNNIYFKQSMRAAPTISLWNDSGTANTWLALPSVANRTVSAGGITENGFSVTAATTGDGSLQGVWAASAEL